MINNTQFVHTPCQWNQDKSRADMHDLQTPSSDDILNQYLPSQHRDKIYITGKNDPSEFDSFANHIMLDNGHWYAICDNKIYCSLGKPYEDRAEENVTKYLLTQSPHSAVCGAYASLYCLSNIRNGDPLYEQTPGCHFVITNSSDYAYDLFHKDINIRDDNDLYITNMYNRQRNG